MKMSWQDNKWILHFEDGTPDNESTRRFNKMIKFYKKVDWLGISDNDFMPGIEFITIFIIYFYFYQIT